MSSAKLGKTKFSKISRFFLAGALFLALPVVLSFAQEATLTPPDQTATTAAESVTSNPTSSSPPVIEKPQIKEPQEEEVQSSPLPPVSPPQPPLKERKLEKQIVLDKYAQYRCQAANFTTDISNKDSATVELDLNGSRDSLENLEIGSLPDGIDITFLNNAGYEWRPQKSEDASVLQIINQPGSQKGNFSIPIIYQSGNSTTICQINVINF